MCSEILSVLSFSWLQKNSFAIALISSAALPEIHKMHSRGRLTPNKPSSLKSVVHRSYSARDSLPGARTPWFVCEWKKRCWRVTRAALVPRTKNRGVYSTACLGLRQFSAAYPSTHPPGLARPQDEQCSSSELAERKVHKREKGSWWRRKSQPKKKDAQTSPVIV